MLFLYSSVFFLILDLNLHRCNYNLPTLNAYICKFFSLWEVKVENMQTIIRT